MEKEIKLSLRIQILLTMFAIIGISLKPIVSPIANIITDPFHVMGGSVAGGIYMMILVLARRITGYKHSATYVGMIQGILSILLGLSSFQGLLAILVYTIPGVVIDGIYTYQIEEQTRSIIACIAANLTGSLLTNILFFQVPIISLLLMILFGIASSFTGATACNYIYLRIKKAIRI